MKVRYGISNVHIFERTETDGTVTYGSPITVPGAVHITLDPQGSVTPFHADNIVYWIGRSNQGYEGELELALILDAIKTSYLGYVAATNGNLIETNKAGKECAIVFQFETDTESRRCVLYNVQMSRPSRDFNTVEEDIDPETETLDFAVSGETVGNVQCFMAEVKPSDSNYNTVFTAVALPVFGE